jgi:formylglycine-generating enzyme required for sulfatase activity
VQGRTVRWAKRDCTGYRLPTADEWAALRIRGETGSTARRCPSAGCPDLVQVKTAGPPNAWFLYDLHGNAPELVMSLEGDGVRWQVVGEDGTLRPWTARDRRTGFRVVRAASYSLTPSGSSA